jgi:hypothetical protein
MEGNRQDFFEPAKAFAHLVPAFRHLLRWRLITIPHRIVLLRVTVLASNLFGN